MRVLETLVILGLAHPGALAQHRISLANEGKRLAYLLEKSGQYERAYCLGELIAERAPAEALGASAEDTTAVEQLVRDAEFAAARGRTEVGDPLPRGGAEASIRAATDLAARDPRPAPEEGSPARPARSAP